MIRTSILGYGWLGKALCKHLISKDYKVCVSTTSVAKLEAVKRQGLKCYLIDIEQDIDFNSDFFDSDVLIVAVPPLELSSYEKLLSALETSSIRKVVFISSTSIYQDSDAIITETDLLKNGKLCDAEEAFRVYPSLQTTVIRFAGLLGPSRHPSRFFNKNSTIKNPEGIVNMIHQEDCIRIIERILNQGIWSETFNACAPSHPSRRDFYTAAFNSTGQNPPSFADKTLSSKHISSDKLIAALSYEFVYPDLIKYLRSS